MPATYRVIDQARRHVGGVYYWTQRNVYYFFCASCWISSGWKVSWELSDGPLDTHSHPIYADQIDNWKVPCCYGHCLNVVGDPFGVELCEVGSKILDCFMPPSRIRELQNECTRP